MEHQLHARGASRVPTAAIIVNNVLEKSVVMRTVSFFIFNVFVAYLEDPDNREGILFHEIEENAHII